MRERMHVNKINGGKYFLSNKWVFI